LREEAVAWQSGFLPPKPCDMVNEIAVEINRPGLAA